MHSQSKRGKSEQPILWQHRNWSELYMTVWQAGALAVFAAVFLILMLADASPSGRTDAYIVTATFFLVGAIWQAAGLAVARIHRLLEGRDLKAPNERPRRTSRQQPPQGDLRDLKP